MNCSFDLHHIVYTDLFVVLFFLNSQQCHQIYLLIPQHFLVYYQRLLARNLNIVDYQPIFLPLSALYRYNLMKMFLLFFFSFMSKSGIIQFKPSFDKKIIIDENTRRNKRLFYIWLFLLFTLKHWNKWLHSHLVFVHHCLNSQL